MNVVFIYDCIYPESLGGVEHRNARLAQALNERGHCAKVAGWTKRDPAAAARDGVIALPYRTSIHDGTGRRTVAASLRLAAAAASIDLKPYDIVETSSLPYLHLPVLLIRCALARKPLIVTWHEFFGGYWRQYTGSRFAPAFRAIEWLCVQFGTVTAQTPLTAERVQQARIGNRPEVALLLSGVSLRDIRAAAASPAPSVPPLLYAGRLIPEKRVDLLLAAVALLRKRMPARPGPLLGIAGAGPDRARLEGIAAELGIEADVVFYGLLPDIADVWRLLAGTSIAVQPSSREGFGLFTLEAIALGRPVVVCEAPDSAVTDVVRDNIEGLCCAATPEMLSATIERLLDDAALWKRLSRAGRLRAELYDWSCIAERFENLAATVLPATLARPAEFGISGARLPNAPSNNSR